jgi:tetratricopeptide (TPR) repeat protein
MNTLLTLLTPLCLVQSVEYRSPAGVEYRSQRDTGAIARAESALAADPRNVDKIIALGVAQSGVRQYREAIATFTRGLGITPNNALLYRWRGHRYLSTRQFDKAMDDLQRGAKLDSTIYGIWYHLGIVRFVRRDFAGAVDAFTRALPMSPDSAERAGSTDWLWMSLSRAAAEPKRRRCSIAIPTCRTRVTPTRSGCASIAAKLLLIRFSRPPTPATSRWRR